MWATLQKQQMSLQNVSPGLNGLCCGSPVLTSFHSLLICRMTTWRKAASFVILSDVSPTLTRREVLSPRPEFKASVSLKPLTDVYRIPPHKRRSRSGVLTPTPVDDYSNGRHSRLGSTVPVTIYFLPAGAWSESFCNSLCSFPEGKENKHGGDDVNREKGGPGGNSYCGGNGGRQDCLLSPVHLRPKNGGVFLR